MVMRKAWEIPREIGIFKRSMVGSRLWWSRPDHNLCLRVSLSGFGITIPPQGHSGVKGKREEQRTLRNRKREWINLDNQYRKKLRVPACGGQALRVTRSESKKKQKKQINNYENQTNTTWPIAASSYGFFECLWRWQLPRWNGKAKIARRQHDLRAGMIDSVRSFVLKE